MVNKCCVPFCTSNYKGKERASAFSFPKDPELANKWLEAINRESFVPGPYTVVCIHHFAKDFIVREYQGTTDDGTALLIPRGKVALADGAYPTLFLNRPKLFNKGLRRSRKTLKGGSLLQSKQGASIQKEIKNDPEGVVPDATPVSCSAFGCTTKSNDSGVQFFPFPLKNRKILQLWINAMGRKDWFPANNSRICSKHFTNSDYYPGITLHLNNLAVPSIFTAFPVHLERDVKRCKLPVKCELQLQDTMGVGDEVVIVAEESGGRAKDDRQRPTTNKIGRLSSTGLDFKSPHIPKKRKTDEMARLGNIVERLQRISRKLTLDEPGDEFDAFANSVSVQLRELSLEGALHAQAKIQAILTEQQIHEIQLQQQNKQYALFL